MALKYIEEYRDALLAKDLIKKIHAVSKKNLRLMEVCGTHTMSIFRHGIRSVIPDTITLLSGPGCPVCVTAQKDIDAFVEFARVKDVIVTTFGDLIKVPGSGSSLGKEKAAGADVRIVYSISDAVHIARENKDKQIVFCAVGFETTIPTIAAGILMAIAQKVDNFSIYSANKLTPPALAALMETKGVQIDGFILPGHVSVITGTNAYRGTFEKYAIPSVIAGFEPIDILKAILLLIQQNESGIPALENAYPRAVSDQGNLKAKQIMNQVFEVCAASWRGIGEIPLSGMGLKKEYQAFNAAAKFGMDMPDVPEPKGCACGQILMGLKTPEHCALYKKKCTPLTPVGPCMVSSEGACAAFYRYA
ncbi:MAG: hydrogenase formation protein HypD [Proteobacteria bacterium]|nr:hydrogenase formation protein HypD [Pseudomonadota bacterium]MBU1583244.1 hydrogenase formation protein HypD [Pseudomonadota bacterium]MBU2455038.1 hydrogenase formation protein HypD [Pseudomonadota bacterium]MBU2627265.1 hydrogenase formation protein HypD [Pseudomonadota bacterium]